MRATAFSRRSNLELKVDDWDYFRFNGFGRLSSIWNYDCSLSLGQREVRRLMGDPILLPDPYAEVEKPIKTRKRKVEAK